MFKIHRIIMPALAVGLIHSGIARAEEPSGALDALKTQIQEMQASIQKMQEEQQQEHNGD